MWVHVLGSAAGGGFPQWNCNCPNCQGARSGTLPCRPRTQSSIAVSADYQHWFLFNASPDIRSQISAFPPLWPQSDIRHTPLQGVVLSDAELDHSLGLLSLREARSLRIYTTEWVYTALNQWNPILRTLSAYCAINWQPVKLAEVVPLYRSDGVESGLHLEAFTTLSTKTLAYAVESAAHPESTVGYRITDVRTNRTLVYMPAVQELNAVVRSQLQDCVCLLIDGTCWHDDELVRLGISSKAARAMGHLPVADKNGSLEQLVTMDIERIIYIHMNNTNPLLIENSPQRQAVEAYGIEVAFDEMELEI
ncbi:MAG: pyrroloquinoline quinone biosynthesis protein PqqB [Ktedonobacteraceae bacterium]